MAQEQPISLNEGSSQKENLIRLKQQLIERKTGQRFPGSWRLLKHAIAGPSPRLAAGCPPVPTAPPPHIASSATSQAFFAPITSAKIKALSSASKATATATAEATTAAITNTYRLMALMDSAIADPAKEPAPISVTVSPSPSVASRMTPPSQHRPKPGLETIQPPAKKAFVKEASTPNSALKPAIATTPATGSNTQPLAVKGVPTGPSLSLRSASVKKFAPAAKVKGRITPYTTPTKAAIKKSDKKSSSFDRRDSLERLLLVDNDLKLWLEHTRFFDQQHRVKVLDGVKRLKAIDDERNRLVSQVHDDTGVILTPAAPSSGSQGRERGRSTYHRAESPVSRDYRRLSRSRSCSRSPRQYRARQSSALRRASRSPLRFNWPYQSPSIGSRSRNLDGFNFISNGLPRDEDRPFFAYRRRSRLDFGEKGDTRFFLVKSFNIENVHQCQRDGIWVTQVHNGVIFADAFRECHNVILIFSFNQSRASQGYARISTPPSPSIPPPAWVGSIQFQATHPLRLEWINTNEMPFSYVADIKNPLNEDASVVLGRDGQEYSDECGRALISAIGSVPNHERGRY